MKRGGRQRSLGQKRDLHRGDPPPFLDSGTSGPAGFPALLSGPNFPDKPLCPLSPLHLLGSLRLLPEK